MSNVKDKLKFVNDYVEDKTFLVPEEEMTFEEEVKDALEREKLAKKKKRKKYYLAALIMFIISLLLFGFGLLWQWDLSLMAIGDALWLAFAIELTVAWILFVYNHNILSPMIHGLKSFSLMIVGKRPKMDYYTYMKKIQDDPIPSFYYIVVFISAGILLIPALITLFILI
jgi:hypothetical protein